MSDALTTLRPTSSYLDPDFHADVQNSETTKLRQAVQNLYGQNHDLQMVLNSREPAYARLRLRTINGKPELCFWYRGKEKSGWVTLLRGEGEITTKDYHDSIRHWVMGEKP